MFLFLCGYNEEKTMSLGKRFELVAKTCRKRDSKAMCIQYRMAFRDAPKSSLV